MSLIPTENRTIIRSRDSNNEVVILRDIPIYRDKNTGNDLITLSDVIKAEQMRLSKKYKISIFNIYELSLLYADVKQRGKIIKEKYRFNKMLFYLWKELEHLYGENVLIFDNMVSAGQGPIPTNLKNDLISLQNQGLVDIFLLEKARKIPESKTKWKQLKKKKDDEEIRPALACGLTNKGVELTKPLWVDLDSEMRETILKIKEKFFFMKTKELKKKVHKEFPEYRNTYSKEDRQTFKFLMEGKITNFDIKELSSFHLSKPLNFQVEWVEDGFIISESTLPLNIALNDFSEMKFEINEYFMFLKETYYDVDPKRLAPEALELRNKLIKLLNLGD